MNKSLFAAIRLLGVYTAGRFDLWMLTGNAKASCRAHVMSTLAGKRTPQSKAGITAIRDAFYSQAQIQGDCLAVKETNFIAYCRAADAYRNGESADDFAKRLAAM